MTGNPTSMRVAVVGGGIAGLTAALRLQERGYTVTVLEQSDVLGGNLSSSKEGGVYHDVYPHMFPDWYKNFWRLFEKDLGFSRSDHFEPRDGVKLLRRDGCYLDMRSASTLPDMVANLRCGIEPLPDMFLYGYSMVDLAAQPFQRGRFLSRYSVTGFLNSRAYATEKTAELYDFVLMNIWSVHGDQTAAGAYKDFVEHTLSFTKPMPFAWLLKGSLEEKLIRPLREHLERLGCTIKTRRRVTEVRVDPGSVELAIDRLGDDSTTVDSKHDITFDYAVLAVTPKVLGELIVNGEKGRRIVDRVPSLASVRRLRAEPIPVLDLYLKTKLPGIPKENVGLSWSDYNLTFLDLSQLWTNDPNMQDRTVLVLAASDAYALPPDAEEAGFAMIQRLHEYLPSFDPGEHWGDEKSGICWKKTLFRSNEDNKLFINQVGSGPWRPWSSYAALPEVVFAGDFVVTDVSMATVEAAVLSGLQAAEALWWKRRLGPPVPVEKLDAPTRSQLLALKLALTPSAYWAKWWSTFFEAVPYLEEGDLRRGLLSPALTMLSLPASYTREWLLTSQALFESLLGDPPNDERRRLRPHMRRTRRGGR
ncbi:MAG: FAD-dependent oxidoreductase [Myxococcota bacterium]|nr:FAD-dependent oxidoreductase [Myxococcota bacterium]